MVKAILTQKDMITDADIKKLSKVFVTKVDSKRFATKDDLKKFATKDDLKSLKGDVVRLEVKMDHKFQAIDEKIEWMTVTMGKIYNLLDKNFGEQENFRTDFSLLNAQVQRHEQILLAS